MPIIEIDDQNVEQSCAVCGAVRKSAMDILCMGQKVEQQIVEHVIALPACENCKSQEFLFGATEADPEHPSPGSFGHKHQVLVDVLQEKLLDKNQLAEGVNKDRIHHRKRPQQELNKLFKGRLRLERKRKNKRNKNSETPKP